MKNTKEYNRAYYLAHTEIREKNRKQYQDSEQIRARRAAYAKEYRKRPGNTEKMLENRRRWSRTEAGRAAQAAYFREYRQRPEVQERRLAQQRKRRKEKLHTHE